MKISVIVPVYNAEKYIKKCIESVVNQSFSEWELILIDDGSKDKSHSIIDEYSGSDDRIIAIHQDNSGPGEARNNGIKIATGEYVVFLDSDDYIDSDYLALLSKKAIKADVVFIDVLQVSSDGSLLARELMSDYKNWSKEKLLRSQMTGKVPWGGVRKCVRRSVLIENDIWYTNHKIGEEALYSFKIVYAAKTIDFITDKPVYYYVNHDGSQSKIKMEDPWGGVVQTISDYLKLSGLYDIYANTINAFNVVACVVSIDRLSKMYKGNTLRNKVKERVNKLNYTFDSKYKIDYKSMDKKALFVLPFIRLKLYWVLMLVCKIKQLLKG